MRTRQVIGLIWLLAALFVSGQVTAQSERVAESEERTVEESLMAFADRLQLGLTVATVSIYSPTLDDLHLHAEQLAALLRGFEDRAPAAAPRIDGPALMVEIMLFDKWVAARSFEPDAQKHMLAAVRNIQTYLELAYDATQTILRDRRFDQAVRNMYRVYAYLAAAYGAPDAPPRLPGLLSVLRSFGLRPPNNE